MNQSVLSKCKPVQFARVVSYKENFMFFFLTTLGLKKHTKLKKIPSLPAAARPYI